MDRDHNASLNMLRKGLGTAGQDGKVGSFTI